MSAHHLHGANYIWCIEDDYLKIALIVNRGLVWCMFTGSLRFGIKCKRVNLKRNCHFGLIRWRLGGNGVGSVDNRLSTD